MTVIRAALVIVNERLIWKRFPIGQFIFDLKLSIMSRFRRGNFPYLYSIIDWNLSHLRNESNMENFLQF